MYSLNWNNTKIALKDKRQGQMSPTSSVHHGAYSCQVTRISDQWFSRFRADRHTDRQTLAETIPACRMRAGNRYIADAVTLVDEGGGGG